MTEHVDGIGSEHLGHHGFTHGERQKISIFAEVRFVIDEMKLHQLRNTSWLGLKPRGANLLIVKSLTALEFSNRPWNHPVYPVPAESED